VIEEFHRVKRLPPYVFAEVNRLKAAARARGADIIDLGMGNPDMPTPQHIVDKLVETVGKPRTNRYSASKGIPGLRKAQAQYYARRFGVKLNPETQVVATLGSKEGFANMAQAISAPGDVILVPSPTYPIHEFGFIISGAAIRHIPTTGGTSKDPLAEFLRGVERAVKHSIPKPLAMVLSYPSNPTAQVADLDFYIEAVQLAKRLDLIILSDIAYAEIYYDNNPPPSVLQVPGAIDVAVEFTSLSKTYSMPGWRMGFAVGNERIIYKVRRDCLVDSFGRAGWHIPAPAASMFAWAPIPEAFREIGSVEFAKLLIDKADVAVSPGLGFGEYGEGYVRIALVENEQRLRQAARGVKKMLAK
jgi:alanine-synthesizing transaminase